MGSSTAEEEDTLAALLDDYYVPMDGGPATIGETRLEHPTVKINSMLATCEVQRREAASSHYRGGKHHLGDKKWRLSELLAIRPRIRWVSM